MSPRWEPPLPVPLVHRTGVSEHRPYAVLRGLTWTDSGGGEMIKREKVKGRPGACPSGGQDTWTLAAT